MKMAVDIWQAVQFWPRGRIYHHRPAEGGVHKYRASLPVCQGARGQIAVTPEGDLVTCNQMSGFFKQHGIHMGNVHETQLRELLTDSEYLKAVCSTVGELREENPECRACPYWKLCMGGCRALAMAAGGGYLARDAAKCLYFEHYMGKFAAAFGNGWRCADDI